MRIKNSRTRRSAGLLMYRYVGGVPEVLLVHPGGPFWTKKDEGSWSIPKGEYAPHEDPFEVAKREFREETSFEAKGTFAPLKELKQPSGKIVCAWAFEGDCEAGAIKSNTFSIEWPPHSGRMREFPEVDRAAWYSIDEAKRKITKGQRGFIEELDQMPAAGTDRMQEETL
jgi:predicted NUDIX family NTP pyrophosphohydrolase